MMCMFDMLLFLTIDNFIVLKLFAPDSIKKKIIFKISFNSEYISLYHV